MEQNYCRYIWQINLLKKQSKIWIIIETHIRNTDSYSDTDSEHFILTLATTEFL